MSVPVQSVGQNPAVLQQLVHDSRLSEIEKVSAAAREFEGVFLRQFLKEGLEPMFKGALNENGAANSIYRSYMTDFLASSISQAGGLGFSTALQQQLQHEVQAAGDNA